MDKTLYLSDRGSVADAAELIGRFGAAAGGEARSRAHHSRTLGNHIHYCRWRSIERLIGVLTAEGTRGTIH